ncbi:S8 family peptidase [Streptomyces anandii]|uniref:S8 family peptidase n=1 Tax=Streptomyces anandii TaxID=285454 RepID=A0ABW6H8U4_9ACTN
MARTRSRRPRRLGGVLTAAAAAALAAVTLPAHDGAAGGRTAGTGYLVTLKGDTKALSAAGRGVAARYGARIGQTFGAALNGYAVRADAAQARRLAADPRVASVTRDGRVALDATQDRPPSWGLDRLDRPGLPLDRRFTAPDGGGRGVTVYVIDTGVRITHRDFGGRASYGWDFVGGDRGTGDGNGHGTHVAGTVAGTTYGVAKRASVVSVRVLDDTGAGTVSQVIAGVDWVTRHARRPAVANLSLGGPYNAELDAAVRNSIRAGVTYTVAAGNHGGPAGLYSPADVPQAITVGATDSHDARAAFSDYGSALDLFAPGVSITSAWCTSDTARATFSGTSMAAPHAAGAAALYLAAHPRATPAQVADALAGAAAAVRIADAGPGSPDRILQVPRG